MMSHSAQSSNTISLKPTISSTSSVENLNAVFQAAPTPFLLLKVDSEFTILDANEAYLKATMTKRADIIGKGAFTVFPSNPADMSGTGVSNLQASLRRVIQNGQADVMSIQKYDILRPQEKGGGFEERYWIATNTPVFNKEGKVSCILHHTSDVTEFVRLNEQRSKEQQETKNLQRRNSEMEAEIYVHAQKTKKAEEQAHEMDNRYRLLTSTLPVGVFHSDLENRCLYVNSQWEEMTGIKLEHIENKSWVSVIHPDDQKKVTDILQRNKTVETLHNLEFRILLPKSQGERWVLTHLVPEKSVVDQGIKGYIGSMTDITPQKALEASEKKRSQSLEEINRLKTNFFTNISHEFRTSLTPIFGILEEISADSAQPLTVIQQNQLNIVKRHLLRILKLVNAFFDFDRLVTNRIYAKYQPTSLAKLTTELVSFFEEPFAKAHIQLKTDIRTINEPVYVDREMWERIVLHLLSNALKYTSQGSVTVTLTQQDHHVVFSVEDTGIGIPETDLPHIFEPFYRAQNVLGGREEGAGMGLPLVYELTQLHKGSIKVKSQEGKGSHFMVTIPLGKSHLPREQVTEDESSPIRSIHLREILSAEIKQHVPDKERAEAMDLTASSHKQPVKKDPTSSPSGPKKKVLLVDDSHDSRDYIERELKHCWDVCAAKNAEEGLKMALQELPDLVLSDVVMPKMSGFELAIALRKEARTKMIPIILMSSLPGEEARLKALEVGVDDYIVKPFTRQELLVRIKTHLGLGSVRVALDKEVKEKTQQLGREIEEHKQTASHLKSKEEDYQLMASILPVGIFKGDLTGKLTYANPIACKIAGVPSDDINRWVYTIHPEDGVRIIPLWKKTTTEKRDHFKAEYRFIRPDKSIAWVLGEAIPEKDASQQIKGYIGTITDITDAKLLEKTKAEAAQRIEEEQKLRLQQADDYRQKMERFVDTLCHELRNPANGVYGNVTLLEMLVAPLERIVQTIDSCQLSEVVKTTLPKQIEELKEATRSIDKCIRYQKTLLDDILNLSKIEAGKVRLQEVECDPKNVIQDVIGMFSADMSQKKMQLVTTLPQKEIGVKVDVDRLLQILTNLLSNAIKFTPPHGKITLGFRPLSCKEDETELEFSVEDTGIGMTKEEQSKLFNRFEQVGRSTSLEYGGSGLGLVICKSLITLMKGDIHIESEKSKGTRCYFTIKCPTAKLTEKPKVALKEEKRKPPVIPAPSHIPLNILVVEDNLINQRLLVKLLEKLGHCCKFASNGKEAVDIVSCCNPPQIPFDVILMDIEMPVMNGLEATEEIRAIEKKLPNPTFSVPIIALSGYSSGEYIQKAKLAGMNDFITKPYEMGKLDSIVKEWVEKSKKDTLVQSSSLSPKESTPSIPSGSQSSSSFFNQSSVDSSPQKDEKEKDKNKSNSGPLLSPLSMPHRE